MSKVGILLMLLAAPGMMVPLTGCTLIPAVDHLPGETAVGEGVFFWPAEQPRIRLEAILPSPDRHGRSEDEMLRRPYGTAFDGEDLLVADPGAGTVFRLTSEGRTLRAPAFLLEAPVGVSVCPDGILVSDPPAGSVFLLDEKLKLRQVLAGGLHRPTGTACIGNRHFVVETGAHRLLELLPGGPRVVTGGRGLEEGRFNYPAALTSDGTTLWVGDTLNGRVQQIDPDSGAVLRSFGQSGDAPGNMPRIKGLAVDADGHLWISDALLDQVALYDAAGSYLMSIGRRGNAPGEMNFPAGLAAGGDGRVAVADSMNRRIQVFAPVETGGGN